MAAPSSGAGDDIPTPQSSAAPSTTDEVGTTAALSSNLEDGNCKTAKQLQASERLIKYPEVEFTRYEKKLSPETCEKIGKKYVANDEKSGGLHRTVGLVSGVGIIIGCIIGSGIFISPSGVQKEAGSLGLSLLIWGCAGVFVIFGSFCYIELGLLLRESGGDYSYIHYAFGGFASFLRLWIEAVVCRPGTEAVVALTFATYVITPFMDIDPTDDYPLPVIGVAAAMILIQTAFNCLTIKGTLVINNCCTVAKVVAMFGIIGLGVYSLIARDEATDSYKDSFKTSTTDPGNIARAFYSALFAYQGWNYLNFIVEEIKNPVKTLPRAVLISSFAIILIYLLVNAAFYTGLSPEKLSESNAATIDFIRIVTGWDNSGYIVSLLVAISCFGSGNGVIFTSSRIFFVGARNDQMPKCLLMTNPTFRSPIPAVLLTGFLSICFLAAGNHAIQIINYIAVSYWLAIGVATAALFYYRFKVPKEEYPFRVPLLIPIIFIAGCLFLVVFPFYSKWDEALIGVGIMATGIPVYLIFVRFRCKPLDSAADLLTKVVQIVFCVYDEAPVDETQTATLASTPATTPATNI